MNLVVDLDRNATSSDVTALPALGTYTAVSQLVLASANLSKILSGRSVGVEYLLGTHQLESEADAHASRRQFAAKHDLFRKRARRRRCQKMILSSRSTNSSSEISVNISGNAGAGWHRSGARSAL